MRRLLITAIFILSITVSVFSQETEGETGVAAPGGKIQIQVTGERLSLEVVDADLADVLRAIAQKTGIDLALGEGITGRVSIHLTDATVEEALKKLCRSRALVYEYLPQKKSYRIIQAAAFAETEEKPERVTIASGPAASVQTPSLSERAAGQKANQPGRLLSQADTGSGTGNSTRLPYKPGELLIKFKPGISTQQIEALHQSLGSKVIGKIERLRLQRVKLREGLSEEAAITLYRGADIVEHVEKHALRYPNRVPDDPDYSQQWGLSKIAAPQAWDITQGSPEVIIAVIDSGVDYLHPDLKDNIWINLAELNGQPGEDDDGNGYVDDVRGWDFAGDAENSPGDSDPIDADGHGTHVAGIIAARGNNGLGVAGVTWKIKIIPLKVQADNEIYFLNFAIIDAIQYAIANGAKVVNCSFGGSGSSSSEESAFSDLENAGILAVCAAGNDGLNTAIAGNETYPAGYDLNNIISVAAADQSDSLATFSNYGLTSVDVMAPGVSIYSTLPAGMNTDALVRLEGASPVEYPAIGMLFAGTTPEAGITASAYNCGMGYPDQFPAGVAGNIALIERGRRDDVDFYFSEKVANAQTAGAIGVIIYNNDPDNLDDFDINGGTLGNPGNWIPAVSITRANGLALIALGTPTVALINAPVVSPLPYGYLSGTSMAAPHVAGIAGLIRAQCPDLGYSDIKSAILDMVDKVSTVADKIASGGRVNALAALSNMSIPGDLSRDCRIGLEDAIMAFQILADSTPSLPYPCLWCGKDVNGDSRIGSEEAVFILQKAAGVRE